MHWMNPLGAWALLSLAAIIALYILKQRMEPLEVSSTFLWRRALASMEADRPFQRLRRNLLMFLQLLLSLLLALSIMHPMTVGTESREVIFVFDLSASMQASDGQSTRLNTAIEDARRRLDGMADGARVSVLTAGHTVSQPLARTDDLFTARRTIEGLAAENGSADLDVALSLALALQRELEDVSLIVYTDQILPEDATLSQPAIGKGLPNRAILSLNATDTAAVARVVNYGNAAIGVSVECYADDELVDLRTVDLDPDEIASVQFDLPFPAEKVTARITEDDALPLDNERIWVSRETRATSIVMAGRDNVFVEKALSLRPDVSVIKTTLDEVGVIRAGALTVIDGPLPEVMPERGALLLIDPNEHVGAQVTEPATLTAAVGSLADLLNEYAQVDEIQVAGYRPVEVGTPIWLANGAPVLSVLEEDGQATAIIGFDLHASNLPLLKEFPVFMQRLMAYLAPEPLSGVEDASCCSTLTITPQSVAQSATVVSPSGHRTDIPVTGGIFADTNEPGVYRLLQIDDEDTETVAAFTLHMPASENDIRQVAPARAGAEVHEGRGAAYGREWTPWLIGLLLLVILVEWGVYRRGY